MLCIWTARHPTPASTAISVPLVPRLFPPPPNPTCRLQRDVVPPRPQPRHAGDVLAVRLPHPRGVPLVAARQLVDDLGAHRRVVVGAAVQLVREGAELGWWWVRGLGCRANGLFQGGILAHAIESPPPKTKPQLPPTWQLPSPSTSFSHSPYIPSRVSSRWRSRSRSLPGMGLG
jgi:hypothetical protein